MQRIDQSVLAFTNDGVDANNEMIRSIFDFGTGRNFVRHLFNGGTSKCVIHSGGGNLLLSPKFLQESNAIYAGKVSIVLSS